MDQNELIEEIKRVFQNVMLEDGIGLSEAGAIDDYETDEVRAKCRLNDEKENWLNIASADLNKYHSSLAFFDAKGMRFHLPAYMVAELKGEYFFGMAFTLTHLSEYTKAQFSEFNDEQRRVVREFLFWLAANEDYEYNLPQIQRSLREYWV